VSDILSLGVWAALVVALGLSILLLSALLGPRRRRSAKYETYECGVPLFQDARQRFPARFYLMAIVFLLFDIEVVFLLPWVLLYRTLAVEGLVEILVFMAVLGIGYVYVWKRRVIDWE
jgi:NADH-quinone oxidoreductase subunit A